jgi:hypothetical protein
MSGLLPYHKHVAYRYECAAATASVRHMTHIHEIVSKIVQEIWYAPPTGFALFCHRFLSCKVSNSRRSDIVTSIDGFYDSPAARHFIVCLSVRSLQPCEKRSMTRLVISRGCHEAADVALPSRGSSVSHRQREVECIISSRRQLHGCTWRTSNGQAQRINERNCFCVHVRFYKDTISEMDLNILSRNM